MRKKNGKRKQERGAKRSFSQLEGEMARDLRSDQDGIESYVLGSYTGISSDGTAPEQDADDR